MRQTSAHEVNIICANVHPISVVPLPDSHSRVTKKEEWEWGRRKVKSGRRETR